MNFPIECGMMGIAYIVSILCKRGVIMSITKARKYLSQWKLDDKIQEFDVSSATVELAAQALGCDGSRIAKSLSLHFGEGAMLLVAAGDARIDNHKFKTEFNMKPKMLKADEVEPMIGHAIGGVCPFGIRDNVWVYLDVSMQRFPTIFPACGSANSAIELTPEELAEYSHAERWVDVCKDWE